MIKEPSRQTLRQHYRHYRQNLSKTEQKRASENIIDIALKSKVFLGTQKIACYLANDGELDLMPLILALWQLNINTYLPVLHPFSKGHLLFIQYTETTQMTSNRFGIQEPLLNIEKVIKPEELDCLLIPLVSFDKQGNRLGMGGGFYDRTLEPVITKGIIERPQLIGVAHEGQMSEELPSQGWDIPMQAILTPERLLTTKSIK